MAFNIAIDGPAGAGKSTIAGRLQKGFPTSMWIQGPCTALWRFTC